MSNIDPSPARTELSSYGRTSELWRSPIATLPLWPFVSISAGLLFFLGSVDASAVLVDSWRGIDLLFYYALLLVCWWRISRRRGDSVRELLGPRPSLRQLGVMLMATLAAQALRVGWLASLASLDLVPKYWHAEGGGSSSGSGLAPAELLTVIVVGPVAEEVLFRGLVFRRSLRRMRPGLAALWSSLLFGLCHFDIVGAVSFGLVLVALYVQSGSLWVPIAAHALFNASADHLAALVDARASLGWAIAGAQLVCVPWLIWYVHRCLRRL